MSGLPLVPLLWPWPIPRTAINCAGNEQLVEALRPKGQNGGEGGI
jgi:hypothetical protein